MRRFEPKKCFAAVGLLWVLALPSSRLGAQQQDFANVEVKAIEILHQGLSRKERDDSRG
jgi:hypothetical protein